MKHATVTKKQRCEQAECEAENALARLRRANRKNKLAAYAHLRRSGDPELESLVPDPEDSGLHELS